MTKIYFILFIFETESYSLAKANLELSVALELVDILLPQLSEYLKYKPMPLCLA